MRSVRFYKLTFSLLLVFALLAQPTDGFARQGHVIRRKSVRTVMVGHASWYSENDPGVSRCTANQEVFNEDAMTCALWGVKFNRKVRITNLANGKSVIVRVNDRGPHKKFVAKGRVVDLTKGAFQQIASLKHGLIKIRMELL